MRQIKWASINFDRLLDSFAFPYVLYYATCWLLDSFPFITLYYTTSPVSVPMVLLEQNHQDESNQDDYHENSSGIIRTTQILLDISSSNHTNLMTVLDITQVSKAPIEASASRKHLLIVITNRSVASAVSSIKARHHCP